MFHAEKPALGQTLRLILAAVLVAAAFLLRLVLEQRLSIALPPFILFYPTVIVVALLLGFWPGLLGTALAVSLTDYFIFPPVRQFRIASSADAIALALFCSMGIFLSVVASRYRHNLRRIAAFKTEQTLYQSREMLHAALSSMSDAVYICDTEGRFVEFNDALATFYRFKSKADCARTLAEYPSILDVFMANGEPAPLEMWAVPRALRGEIVSNAEYTLRRKDTGETWIGSYSFSPIRDQNDAISGCVVVVHDITERKRREMRLRRFYETDLFAILYWKIDGGVVDANDKFLEMIGYTREDLRNGLVNWVRMTPPEYQPLDENARRQIRETGVHLPFEKELIRKDGERVWGIFSAAAYEDDRNQGITFISDVTGRKRAEQQLEAVNRALKALSNSNQALLHAADESEFLSEVCRIVTEDCGYAMVWIGYAENDEGKTVRPIAWSGFEDGYLETLKLTWDEREDGRGPTGTAIRSGQPSICRDMRTDPQFAPWRERALKRGYASSLVIPLKGGEKTTGAITIYSFKPDAFSQGEIDLLTKLAADVEFGIETLRLRAAHARAEQEVRESREWLQVTLSSIGDAVLATDTNGHITFLNPVAAALTGWPSSEAEGHTIHEVFHLINEKTRKIPEDIVSRVLNEGRAVELANHTALLARDGREIPIEDSAAPILDDNGKVIGVVLVFHDVTQRRRAEETLRESEKRFHNLFTTMSEGFCIVEMIFDADGKPVDYRFLEVNNAFEAQTGMHEAQGKLMRSLAPNHEQHWFEIYGKIALTGEAAHFENSAQALGRYYDVHAYRVGVPELRQVAIVFNDISALKLAEEERETTIEFLRLVNQSQGTRDLIHRAVSFIRERSGFEAVGVRLREGDDYPYFETQGFSSQFVLLENSICARDADGRVMRSSAGYPIQECMCGNILSGRTDASKPFFTANGSFWSNNTTELLATSTEADRQARTRNRCNGEGYESVGLFPLTAGNERIGLLQLNDRRTGRFMPATLALWERLAGYLATAVSKFRAEELLHASERLYRSIGESIEYGVWVFSLDGRNSYASESFLELLGITQQQSQSEDFRWRSFVHPDDVERTIAVWKECVRTGGIFDAEIRYCGVDGQWHPILVRGVPVRDDHGRIISWAGINLDISKLKRTEDALLRSEKLASMRRLAATIAHEINNPLAAVTNLLYLIRMVKDLPDDASFFLEIADAELSRIAHITRQSLGFYRESMKPHLTSVTALLETCIDLLNGKIRAKQAIIKKEWIGDWNITAVAGELRQVFSNLLVNSLEAIDQGGTIRLRVSACKSDKNGRRAVRVTVVDNGYGIDDTARQHIYEPFFTTKETVGTGLGLWVAKQIVDHHSGTIRMRSNTGGRYKGTLFSVVLPVEQVAETGAPEQ